MNVNEISSNNINQEAKTSFNREFAQNTGALKINDISLEVLPEIAPEKYQHYLRKWERVTNEVADILDTTNGPATGHGIFRTNGIKETPNINENEPDLTLEERRACRRKVLQEIAKGQEEINDILGKFLEKNHNANQSEAAKMLGSLENRSKLTFEERRAYRQKLCQEISEDSKETENILDGINFNSYRTTNVQSQISNGHAGINKKPYRWAFCGSFGAGTVAAIISIFFLGPIGILISCLFGVIIGAISGTIFAKADRY